MTDVVVVYPESKTVVVTDNTLSGPRGIQGLQGPQGPQGLQGLQGPQGIQGPQGLQGDQGIQGLQGDQGIQGIQGPQAFQGVQGVQGSRGIQGIQGPQAFQGVQGETGIQGDLGFQGTQGLQGDQGVQGETGIQGFYGIQGPRGFQGTQGIQGPQAFQGVQGLQGFAGAFGGATFRYTFSRTTADSNPGSGFLRLDDPLDVSLTTEMYISDIDGAGYDIQAFLRTVDDPTSTVKGHIRLSNRFNPNKYAIYSVSGILENSLYFTISLSFVSGNTVAFDDNEDVIISFQRTGDRGIQGTSGAFVAQGIQGSQGLQGVQGEVGIQGADGAFVAQGIQGLQGETGSQGVQGETGIQGDLGFQGTQGLQGEIGSQGTTGLTGPTPWTLPATPYDNGASYNLGAAVIYEGGYYYRTGNPLNPGYPPTPGSINASWTPVADGGLQGTQGVQGQTGETGIQGFTGLQGFIGYQGIQGISGEFVAQGVQGLQGTAGATIDLLSVNTDIIPSLDAEYDLGSESLQWRKVYTGKIQTGGEWNELILGFSDALTANGKFIQIRSGDDDKHVHVDTGDFTQYDQFWGNDSKYVKLDRNGSVEIRAYDANTAVGSIWNFAANGNLTFPDSTNQNTAYTGPSDTLVSGSYTLSLANTGPVNIPTASTGLGRLQNADGIEILTDSGVTAKLWAFSANGALLLPGGGSVVGNNYNVSVISGNDGSSLYGDVNIVTNNPVITSVWSFGTAGELTLPSGGEITSNEITNEVFGTTTTSLTLVPGGATEPGQRLEIYATIGGEGNHLHLTSGEANTELYFGNDSQYVKLDTAGDIVISAQNGLSMWGQGVMSNAYMILPNNADSSSTSVTIGNANGTVLIQAGETGAPVPSNWFFNANGSLTFPDSTNQNTAWTGVLTIPNDSGLTIDGGTGSIWTGPSGVVQTGDKKGGVYHTASTANNGLFTFGINGSGTMSAAVEGSMFIGTALPSNNGGVTTEYPGWLVVQNGGKFGADLETLGNVILAKGVFEKLQTKQDATGVVEHDCINGHIFYHTSPDANWTANFTNLNISTNYATSVSIVIAQGGTGYYPDAVQIGGVAQTIKWQSNATPTPSSNRTDVVTFSILNNSGTYVVLGQLIGF